ncbi:MULTISPECIES: helix-turn-helix transcriptional regulator [Kitasatospora]|uniref:Transcriptional regulator/DNA-binding CsgD family transcriptional regulator n=2 Tax=Kitasatospora TaxID=2063 RepID=A0ABT1ITR2_9ACTN|nr:LuxR family transcriptional regulator [Kitasatospora paracochleata]MCP2308323.1 putative transcriptional regulator/DNA-binding CsgD family transcriptional regulator [Kitasatospora paracochleata]
MSDDLLEPVGLGATESALYLHVLSAPRSTAAQLAEALGSTTAGIRTALGRLVTTGLVTRLAGSPVRYTAAPPEVAMDALAAQRQQEMDRLRARVRELAVKFEGLGPSKSAELVELIEGQEAMRHRAEQLQLGAQEEILIIDCPPYFDDPTANPIEFQLLARGVGYRALYDAPGLEGAARMGFVLECIAAGEQARSLPMVRMKMLVADRRYAMIPLSFEATESTAALWVRPSPLLTALVTCFDLLWERATPLASGQQNGELDDRDRELLAMLASGMKDAAIVRSLGITQRTMTRRIGHILTALNAQTRFQAGLQAARRGWL